MAITQVTNDLIQTNTIPRSKLAFSSLVSSGGAFRNKLINGAMEIDQRNEGGAVIIDFTNINAGSYLKCVPDRWFCYAVGTGIAATGQQVSDAPAGFNKSLKYTVTGAITPTGTDYGLIIQSIEGQFLSDLLYGTSNAKTITVSFWVKSSISGTFSGSWRTVSGNTVLGDDLNPTLRSYVFNYTINQSNTWEFKTITIPGDTVSSFNINNLPGAGLIFSLGAGSTYTASNSNQWLAGNYKYTSNSVKLIQTNGATFQITGVQLEIGSSATGFESLPSSMELQRCQRYFCKSYAPGTVPGTATTTGMIAANSGLDVDTAGTATPAYRADLPLAVTYPVPMRNVPTLVYYNPYVTNTTGAALLGGTKQFSVWYESPGTINPRPQQDENGMGLQYILGNASNIAAQNAVYVFHYTAESEI